LLSEQSCNPKPGVLVLGGGLLHTEDVFLIMQKRNTKKSYANKADIVENNQNGKMQG
jgi:hypothetical protein